MNYPQSLQEFEDNIERKVMNIFRQELCYVSKYILRKCEKKR